jgi:hypothetical protein
MDSARHVIGCHVTKRTRVQHSFDDVASTIHESLGPGVVPRGRGRPGRGHGGGAGVH